MSATLRYDIPRRLHQEIEVADFEFSLMLKFERMTRWAGIHRNRQEVITFAIKLPKQVAHAWRLLEVLAEENVHNVTGAGTLRSKIILSLGLRSVPDLLLPTIFTKQDYQEGFIGALRERPDDLPTWYACSDWLQEQQCDEAQRRGRLIAGWLGPKALKMKYGIPVIAYAS